MKLVSADLSRRDRHDAVPRFGLGRHVSLLTMVYRKRIGHCRLSCTHDYDYALCVRYSYMITPKKLLYLLFFSTLLRALFSCCSSLTRASAASEEALPRSIDYDWLLPTRNRRRHPAKSQRSAQLRKLFSSNFNCLRDYCTPHHCTSYPNLK
jgi:hypothetical protein